MNDIKLEFGEPDQHFNMGGPFLSDLALNGRLLQGKYLVNHSVYSNDKRYLLLSKYIPDYFEMRKLLFISKRKYLICFRILIYDNKNNEYYQQNNFQRCLFIQSMSDNNIVYYEAFHNELEKYKRELLFNSNTFTAIDQSKVYQ